MTGRNYHRRVAEFIYSMQKVRKAHGDKVILDNVTLNFLPGAKIGVVGPNGAGKSTRAQDHGRAGARPTTATRSWPRAPPSASSSRSRR